MNTLSPKETFISNVARSDAHAELCMRPDFKIAVEYAWAEFAWRQEPTDPTVCVQLKGAREFLKIFLNLGDRTVREQAPLIRNLQPT